MTRTTIDLGPDGDAVRESLRQLAQALGLGGNISALMRWLAEAHSVAPDATMTLLEAAGHRADNGDEWITLAIVRRLLPDIALVVRDPMVRDEGGNITGVRLYDEDGTPFGLGDAARANPEEFAKFAAGVGGDEDE